MMAATSNSRLNGNNWAGRKLSPQSYNLKNSDSPTVAEEPDPGQLLNEWLGELDNLQKGLTPSTPSLRSTTASLASSSRESSIRRMSTPRVDSPRLDSYRYSLINLEETLENDLDAILGELCALESHFPTSSSTSTASSTASSTGTVLRRSPKVDQDLPSPPPPLMIQTSEENIEKYLMTSEPQYISAESVRQNKLLMSNGGQQQNQQPQKRMDSPDNDSAFCDNTSSNSGSDNSGGGSQDKNSLNLKLLSSVGTFDNGDSAQAKAEKIRLAIEKIKEASIKKIFIKVFGEDGSAKSLLVDERMTVSQVCRMLAEKNHVKRDTQWGLVELLPDLHMERAYEDNELLVENLLMWKADSKNTLWFIKRPEVFDLFSRPEMYLLGETSSQIGLEMDDRARAELVEEYFASSGVGAPEVEGSLWLKAESKKSWKKFHFVLRTSGLYYAPKGKKTSKDLVCLARFDVNQVYYGVKWQPKFKSPSRHCFAIKHPQIQAKNPKYIRYLCADTEQELNKWVTGIRVAKYGKQLYENYRGIVEEMAHDDLDQLASSRLSSSRVVHAHVSTPDSNLENKSFDSALQMSLEDQRPSSVASSSVTTSVEIHQRSSSTGSLLSERSGVELGFNCDSPEGGTIKKKPALVKKEELDRKPKGNVRFQESFCLIDNLPPPPLLPHEGQGRLNARSASFDSEAELECLAATQKLTRRYSDESLVSNPAMLHSGTLISSPVKSPEPNRPAPVLKPQIGRKPSIEKSTILAAKKQMPSLDLSKKDEHISRQPAVPINGLKQVQQRSPSYEDTLRKCQSLTRHNSSPVPSLAGSPVFRQTSCPVNGVKPAVAPKPPSPAVPPKPARIDSSRRVVAHLPPSGLKKQVNQAFLNDLHQAMKRQQKFPSEDYSGPAQQAADRPFPNRFSSGEYENVQQHQQQNNKLLVHPKRKDDHIVTWDRT